MAVGLLLGAGFSYDLGMPLASEFTKPVFDFLNTDRMKVFVDGMKNASPYGDDSPMDKKIFNDFYTIYQEFMEEHISDYEVLFHRIEALSLHDNEKNRARHFFLGKLEDIINESFLIHQMKSYTYYKINKDLYVNFLNKLCEEDAWVFTLNHDICLDMLCIDYNVPFTYGTDAKIGFPISNEDMSSSIVFDVLDANVMNINDLNFNNSNTLKIMKLHGGLNEFNHGDEKTGRKRIVITADSCKGSADYLKNVITVWHGMQYIVNGKTVPVTGEICVSDFNGKLQFLQSSILSGSQKYHTSLKPLEREEKMPLFSSALEKVDKLYIIGYSFRDIHINMRIQKAMYLNDKLQVIVIDPFMKKQEILAPFDYDMRVRYANMSSPVWMDYEVTQKWDAEIKTRLDIMNKYVRREMIDNISNIFIR